jgi:catechol 2,3-dioxygenase-like lactoylglutathione lyase family enzyme
MFQAVESKYAGDARLQSIRPRAQSKFALPQETEMSLKLSRWLPALLYVSALLSSNLAAEESTVQHPSIKENTIMLYYKDLAAVTQFYETTLGLSKTFDEEWVKIYQLTPSSSVGLVREGETSFHRAQAENAVMLSIISDDVDAWYQRLKQVDGIEFLLEIHNSENVPIRSFLVKDPGGYSIEFFQWLNVEK